MPNILEISEFCVKSAKRYFRKNFLYFVTAHSQRRQLITTAREDKIRHEIFNLTVYKTRLERRVRRRKELGTVGRECVLKEFFRQKIENWFLGRPRWIQRNWNIYHIWLVTSCCSTSQPKWSRSSRSLEHDLNTPGTLWLWNWETGDGKLILQESPSKTSMAVSFTFISHCLLLSIFRSLATTRKLLIVLLLSAYSCNYAFTLVSLASLLVARSGARASSQSSSLHKSIAMSMDGVPDIYSTMDTLRNAADAAIHAGNA